MHVKRFEAADMAEALRMVKLELGPNAIILSTRQIKKAGGAFGIFGRSFVEVTAAVDHEAVDPARPALQPRAHFRFHEAAGGRPEPLAHSRRRPAA